MALPKSNSAKILVAEDDVLIALSLQQTLSLFGFEVVGIAATVGDALCLAQNTRPDLAIFDIQLAGKRDGIEGAALLRSLLDIRPARETRLPERGRIPFIPPPFCASPRALSKSLPRSRRPCGTRSTAPLGPDAAPRVPQADFNHLLRLKDGSSSASG
jgi:CheY-like chemotaxis protein